MRIIATVIAALLLGSGLASTALASGTSVAYKASVAVMPYATSASHGSCPVKATFKEPSTDSPASTVTTLTGNCTKGAYLEAAASCTPGKGFTPENFWGQPNELKGGKSYAVCNHGGDYIFLAHGGWRICDSSGCAYYTFKYCNDEYDNCP